MLAEGAPRDPAPRIIVPTQNIRFDPIGERLANPYVKAATLAFVAVAIAFAAMYWAMFVRPKPPALAGNVPAAAATSAPVPAPAVPSPPPPEVVPPAGGEVVAQGGALPEPPPVAPAPAPAKATASKPSAPPKDAVKDAARAAAPAKDAAKDAPKDIAKEAAPTRVAAADAAAKPAKAGGRKAIHFHFDGDSWVEIRDASGKVLFQKLNPAGSDADVAARAPVDVIVGNAPEVRMTLDGADFPLEPHTNVAVARFTLE
jgi:cytoskeleton protein RodZ